MYSLPLLSRSMEGERSFSSASNSTHTEDNEYVWDGFTHADQLVATPTDDDYYEDLELAARLGKTLLQKNKELDTLNYQLRCCSEEQSLEIEHLNKQLAWLREVNESKTRMIEQLDVNYQELEGVNRKLRSESKEWKERVTKCMSVCENQEEQIQNLKSEIESVRKMHEGKRSRERMRRRTIHGCLPTFEHEETEIQKFLETSAEFSSSLDERRNKSSSSVDEEVSALHEVIGNLRAQQVMDKRMIKEMRKELEAMIQENQDCVEKLQEEREMTLRLNHIIEEYDKVIYRQAFVAESTPNITEEFPNNEINFSDHSDDEESLGKHVEVNLASRAGIENKSSFQSPFVKARTPMSQYLRIANSTPLKSPDPSQTSQTDTGFGSDNMTNRIPNIASQNPAQKAKVHREKKSEPKNVSLVQELDTQYKTLLGKYEMLLHSIESERVASPATDPRGEFVCVDQSSSFLTDSLASEQDTSGLADADGNDRPNLSHQCSTESVPEYKRLFREIFHILHEARDTQA